MRGRVENGDSPSGIAQGAPERLAREEPAILASVEVIGARGQLDQVVEAVARRRRARVTGRAAAMAFGPIDCRLEPG